MRKAKQPKKPRALRLRGKINALLLSINRTIREDKEANAGALIDRRNVLQKRRDKLDEIIFDFS